MTRKGNNPQDKTGCAGCVSLILLATFAIGVGTVTVFLISAVVF